MTPKEVESIISQLRDLRFQLLIRIQFHLKSPTIYHLLSLRKTDFEKNRSLPKGAKKMIQGYFDLFDTDEIYAFLLKDESIQTAESIFKVAIEPIKLNNKKINWTDIKKNSEK